MDSKSKIVMGITALSLILSACAGTHNIKQEATFQKDGSVNQVLNEVPMLLNYCVILLQGRCARKGQLRSRITVTLPIFIFSTCFLVQNCRESQGASF